MGLKGGIENQYGASFTYHKISDIHIIINDEGSQLRITTDSYVDKEARKNGKAAVKTVNVIENADFAMTAFYALLKAKFEEYGRTDDEFEDGWKGDQEQQDQIFTRQTSSGQLISKRKEK